MNVFVRFVDLVSRLPDWLTLLSCPVLALCVAVVLFLCKKKQAFLPIALALGALGFSLVCCEGESRYAFIWAGLYAAECVALRRLLAIKRKKTAKKSKEEYLYDKFKGDLGETDGLPPTETVKFPPKVCCFEEDVLSHGTAEESGIQLEHVTALLNKLQTMNLSAGDRLETDVLARTLDLYREKPLTAPQLRTLNDCFATILKLTAKYQL